ncbi:MAG: IclR family transcriptional regulator C-terminal domain-containing protein [Bacteroidota bacterium]
MAESLSLEQRVYNDIRAMIVDGRLQPGQQIVQEALAEELGVSRTPLRKAIAELAKEQFLDLSARGVAYVRTFTPSELTSIWEIRAVLEGLACRMAAERLRPAHIAYLRTLITGASERATPNDASEYREADIEFHRYIARSIGDPSIDRLLHTYQTLSIALAQGFLRSPKATLPEHLRILDALKRRDPQAAEQAMVEHLRNALGYIRAEAQRRSALASFLPPRFEHHVREPLSQLGRDLNETVAVGAVEAESLVIVQQIPSQQLLRVTMPRGERLPLHATAAGKVLLASTALRRQLTPPFAPFTPYTVTEIDRLETELDTVKINGYAVEDEEFELGLSSIAVPIRDANNLMIAALSVILPKARFEKDSMRPAIERLEQTADAIPAL